MQRLDYTAVRQHAAFITACWLGWLAAPAQAQTLDSFNPAVGVVYGLAIQPDGKILVGDARGVWRFNTNGSADATLVSNPASASGSVTCVLVQPDGRIVVGGSFLRIFGQSPNYLARINSDGTLDASFNPGPSGIVNCLALQPDGSILAGGWFATVAGETHSRIARFNPDGSLDSTFNAAVTGMLPTQPPVGALPVVYSLAVQPDGGIVVGGTFTKLNGVNATNLGRLYPDGTLDTGFAAEAATSPVGFGSSAAVYSLAVQPNGCILVGGVFRTLDGSSIQNFGRLNLDGTVDGTFSGGAGATVESVVLQADGKILACGQQSTLPRGTMATNLWRVYSTGARETSFIVRTTGSSGVPTGTLATDALAVQADGRILFGGSFVSVDSQTRTNLGRLNNTSAATQTLDYDGWTITWLRGDTSPEVWRTTFEISTDGVNWSDLGAVTRISGGWQLSGLAAPANATLRARGFMTGGQYNGSGWFAETSIGPPAISVQPANRTNNAATLSGFTVQAAGTAPLGFQWFKDGVALTNGGGLAGAQTSTLVLSNVLGGNAGAYSVVITNLLGSVSSQTAFLTVVDPLIAKEPASLAASVGQTVAFTVAATGTLPMTYQWRKNSQLLPGATTTALTLTNLARSDAAVYDVVVANRFGSLTSSVAMLTLNLAALDTFGLGVGSTNGSAVVYALALQPDNRVLVGGALTTLGGQPAAQFGRLNADGTPDGTFNANAGADGTISCLSIQDDGRILAGGDFYSLDGQTVSGLGRVESDGTLDAGFNPAVVGGLGAVDCLALPGDGGIVVGGGFISVDGQLERSLAEVNADGTIDNGFASASVFAFGRYPQVLAVAVQPDGEMVVGGAFDTLDSVAVTNLGRLYPDGSLDYSFVPQAGGPIFCVALQPDGRVLVGGGFTNLAGQSCAHLARLNTDGTLDAAFTSAANDSVYSMVLQTDGRILVGGAFTNLDGQSRSYLGRLESDGSLDPVFDPEPNATVSALLVAADGKILAGGAFTNLAGTAANGLARLINTDPALQTLTFDSSSITWLRSGAGPEVWRTVFAMTTNGVDWVNLGAASRIGGGWQLSGLALPANPGIRAHGMVSGGQYNGSGSIIEAFAGRAVIAYQPVSRTNNAATPASFSVLAGGTPALSYQWRKDGVWLADGGTVSGTQTATLWLSNVFGIDAGAYSVVVTNAMGAATSAPATLTVVDPFITVPPANQSGNAGATLTLQVVAVGTTPLSYQWRQGGTNLAGATASALTLGNVQAAAIGLYDVVVTNAFGVSTSAAAVVSVNLATSDATFATMPDGEVDSILPQPDGRTVLGGWFNWLGGQSCSRVGRLNIDGTVDTNFAAQIFGSPPYYVAAMALQTNGAIVIGGGFSSVNGITVTNIARLLPDGTLDTNFMATCWLPGADNGITCLALQPNGQILAGGYFVTLGGTSRNYLGRLNTDGSLDAFNPGANGDVFTLALQPDGAILAGGMFTTLAGQLRSYLGRLSADGTLDNAFDPNPDNWVYALTVQADGKILVGGGFTNLAGESRAYLARLNADGSLDQAFNPGANGDVVTFAVQADGKILVGGRFTVLAGQPANYLGRLNADGSRDLTFYPAQASYVTGLALQADGKLVVGGSLEAVLGRLNATEPATQNLRLAGSTITWSRGGTGPEIGIATCEASADGVQWTPLGNGTRIAGGWQWSGVAVPRGARIRARGSVVGGYFNGSAWFVETTSAAPPVIILNDGQFGFRPGGFGFNTWAAPGEVVVIEASTNLVDWVPVQTNTATGSGLFLFADPEAHGFPHRSYRARVQ